MWARQVAAALLLGVGLLVGCGDDDEYPPRHCDNGECVCGVGSSCDMACLSPPCHATCAGDNPSCSAVCANGDCGGRNQRPC